MIDLSVALAVGIFYFGFYAYVLRFIYKNKYKLYTKEVDEELDNMTLE